MMDHEKFNTLSKEEIAQLIKVSQPFVCAFQFNGTRRWFALEGGGENSQPSVSYLKQITKRLIETCQLLFSYGIDTLIMPLLNGALLQARGEKYAQMTTQSLVLLTNDEIFDELYTPYQVRTRFYGRYQEYLNPSLAQSLERNFAKTVEKTATYGRNRLFWGICAEEPTTLAASLAVNYFAQHGKIPNKADLCQVYYGERIPELNLIISSSKPQTLNIPLLVSGGEALYFTVAPSPFMDDALIRSILYDYLFVRPKDDVNYQNMTHKDWEQLRNFYQVNRNEILGVGTREQGHRGVWKPAVSISNVNDEKLDD